MRPPNPADAGEGGFLFFGYRMAASAAIIAEAQAELDALVAARLEILTDGQEIRVNGRSWRAADLAELNREIREARNRLARLQRRGVRQVVPR